MIRHLLSITFLLLFLPLTNWAAMLYLEPAEGQYHQADTFLIEIRLDTEGECINTVNANLSFSQDILEAIDFSQGDSILTVWLESPTIDQSAGLISFIGGIPAGFCGRIPGDPGTSNLLGKIIFNVPGIKDGLAEIKFLNTSQALLNDGLGTKAELSTQGAILTVLPGISEIPKKEWQEELTRDKTPPEVFKIEVNQNSAIFEGKYFIIFSTIDKQTGLDYFEVKEGEKDWQKAASPYLLEDQALQTIIKVKAVDKAGNERITEHAPSQYAPSQEKNLFLYLGVILTLLAIGIIWWVIRRFIKTTKNDKEQKIKF